MIVSRKGLLLVWFLFCLSMLGNTGCCSWTDKSGTRHVLIVGIGIVSVNKSKPAAATVSQTHALGITISDQTGVDFGIGYSSAFVTAVPKGAEDVRIEASQHPFASIKIEAQKAQSNQTNRINKGVK
jgi:hypothetical protein